MTSKPPAGTLAIITVTWNHADEIGEFLDAISNAARQLPFSVETIVVDNDSADGTADLVERDYPWVRLIRSGGNLGFAAGCNLGLEAANADFLLLLNPDARANAPALAGMRRFLRRHPRAGVVGCRLLHADGLPQQSAFKELSPIAYWEFHSFIYPAIEKAKKIAGKAGLLRDDRPRRVGWMQGACLMIPRAVYEGIGGLDPSYFIYTEDADWCYRIRQAGYAAVFLPQFSIAHRQMSSTRRKPEWCYRRVYRSLLHFANKHYHGPRWQAVRAAMLLDMYLRLPAYYVQALLRPGRRASLRSRLASTRQLIAILRAGDPDLFSDPPPR